MKNGLRVSLAVLISSFVLYSCSRDKDGINEVSNQDMRFVVTAAMSNYAEIQAGLLAAEKGDSASGVEGYGELMVEEHTAALQQLKDLAEQLGLHAPDSLSAEHLALADSLMEAEGSAFDSIYIHSQVRDHEAAWIVFENEANNGLNSQLRNYALAMLPRIQVHLTHAKMIAKRY